MNVTNSQIDHACRGGCVSRLHLCILALRAFCFRQAAVTAASTLLAAAVLHSAEPPAPTGRTLSIPVELPPAAAGEGMSLKSIVVCGAPLPLSGVAFSPDGKSLAVGGYGEVTLWDLAGAKIARRFVAEKEKSMVQAVAFDKSGKQLFAGAGEPDASGSVLVFDTATGALTSQFKEPKGPVTSLATSPDGKLLAAGSGDGNAYVWNPADGKCAATLKFHKLAVLHVGFSVDGKYLTTAGADRAVQVWETSAWKPDRRETRLEDTVRRCYLRSSRPSGADVQHQFALVVGGRESRSIQVRLDDKAASWSRKDAKAQMSSGIPLDGLWISRKGGNRVYVACSDGTVKVFDEISGPPGSFEPVATLSGHTDWVYGIAASPDNKRLASVSGDGTVKLWDLATNRLLATLVQLRSGSDDWAIVTSRGYCAASVPGTVKWEAKGIQPTPEQLAALVNPELARSALAGQETPEPALR